MEFPLEGDVVVEGGGDVVVVVGGGVVVVVGGGVYSVVVVGGGVYSVVVGCGGVYWLVVVGVPPPPPEPSLNHQVSGKTPASRLVKDWKRLGDKSRLPQPHVGHSKGQWMSKVGGMHEVYTYHP
jgi:hypothetical protein